MPGPRAGRRQLAAGSQSQSTGSSEAPPPPPAHGAHKPLASGSKKGNNLGIFISDPKYLQHILSLTNIEIIRFVEQKQLMANEEAN